MTKWIKFGAHTHLSVVLEPAHFYSTSQTGERFIFNWVKNNWVNIAVFPSPKLLIPGKFPEKKKRKGVDSFRMLRSEQLHEYGRLAGEEKHLVLPVKEKLKYELKSF